MKQIERVRALLRLAVLLTAAACGSSDASDPYGGGQNPVIATEGLADPHAILFGGKYDLYPTGDARGYDAYVSDDLLTWTKAARVFDNDAGSVWAPDVYYDEDTRRSDRR